MTIKKLLYYFKYNFLPTNFKKIIYLYPLIARLRFFFSSFIKNQQTIKLDGFSLKVNLIDHPSRILYSYRNNYEYETIGLCKDILKEGDVVIDIGANVGYFSYIFNLAVGNKGKVYSFEPNPEVYNFLEDNLSRFSSSKVYQQFVSDKENKIKYTSPNSLFEELSTETVSINNFINEKKIDLIKIDIDGLDFLALKGCSKYLESKSKPKIIIEIGENSEREHNIHYNEIFIYLENMGYKAFNADKNQQSFDLSKIKKNEVLNVYFKNS
tara:strand:- start:3078 stop:3881 length:804 start_codon:yes stop_codon:yes gene_type:complete